MHSKKNAVGSRCSKWKAHEGLDGMDGWRDGWMHANVHKAKTRIIGIHLRFRPLAVAIPEHG